MTERSGTGVGDRLRIALRSPGLVVGIAIITFWTACALFGERIAPFDPYADNLLATLAAPSLDHPFGTDQLGRDILSRVIIGSTDILTVSLSATLLGTLAGTVLGLALGYFGGVFDALASRVIEALQALPLIIIALIALAAVGTSNLSVILVIAFTFTLLIARTVRSAVKIETTLDYIAAARLRGDGAGSIMFVEILPNVVPLIVVETTVRLGFAIFFVASLSFLGFGIQPPSPDWGLAIAENYGLIGSYWWTVLFDAGAIASLIIGFVLVAEALQGLFDR
ncbi:ABC transporter permease [Sphingomonas sp. UV9]|uniref:ABC transporter permease n=1 Tax=Sphingomonas sp. UV9 TaxID=1851410 RepID=UPI000FFC6A43|nr:ABC transporter permease [Sphingomonas sp. UV9]RXD07277.1 ABC transporter permease [Sphingomonas sp. UV9]